MNNQNIAKQAFFSDTGNLGLPPKNIRNSLQLSDNSVNEYFIRNVKLT